MANYRAIWDKSYSIEFRDLSWEEYDKFCSYINPNDIDPITALQVYKTCVIKAPADENITAGIAYFVARHQIQNNPFAGDFKSVNSALEKARVAVSSNYLIAAQAVIANTFRYSLEEIKSWSAEKFFLRMAQAEVLVGNRLNPSAPEDKKPEKIIVPLSTKDKINRKVAQKRSSGSREVP